ncbi:MAG TPA: bifunctional YncE family protein/alkaline phosphatase family protein [Gemmatimonadales bacterium]|nr:bifunctional YncE family protein/alkaline phosphatase family protein [Gemmatimonadales bacterium]
MTRKSLLFGLAGLAALGFTWVATRAVPGPQSDGTTLLPSGWRILPAGRQVQVGSLPLNLVTLSDGRVAVTNDGYGPNGVTVVDPKDASVTAVVPLPAAWVGIGRSAVGDTLWASGGVTNRVYRLVRSTSGWMKDSAVLADSGRPVFPGGLAVGPGGKIAVVGNLSDSLYLLDAGTLARAGAFKVGHHPYTVVADARHWYVSDWGDSTVTVINAAGAAAESKIFVGPHPSALAIRGADLFAALAGANGVARVNLATGRVLEQLTIALAPRAPTGGEPNGLGLSPDGRRLYVALAGDNAVAVVRVGRASLTVAGLLPAGWYPTGVTVSGDGRTLFIINGKGAGSGPNPDGTYIGKVITGTLSIVPVPDSAALARYTARVKALSPYTNAALRGARDVPSARPPIRHIVYVIRENRTYDQVLGDDPRGDGDPKLAIFGDSITPNAHALARRFVLFDNFFVDGEVSADGHEWTDRAFAGDYNEKTWPAIYSGRRDWDLTSGEDLANPGGAYLWDAATRAHRWVVNFGEGVEGEQSDSAYHTNFPGLKRITDLHYPSFVLAIPDTVRARMFSDSVDSWDRQGKFPDLVFLYLPRDHTLGRRPEALTPRAMVADNDLALGRVVERLTRSPAWASLAVFALEDDAQNGPDHVDAHRSVFLVASPFARAGAVDSTFYTTSSVVRTIGLLLGLPPLSQYDAAATPLWPAFSARADLSPFTALANRWPLDERTPHAARSTIPARDLAERPDAADDQLLNAEIWESVRPGERVPAPRHRFVLVAPSGGTP